MRCLLYFITQTIGVGYCRKYIKNRNNNKLELRILKKCHLIKYYVLYYNIEKTSSYKSSVYQINREIGANQCDPVTVIKGWFSNHWMNFWEGKTNNAF